MNKRILAIFILAALMLSMLAACDSGKDSVLSAEDVQQIALDAAGLDAEDVDDVHAHVATYQDTPCFSIHITVGTTEYEYLIDAYTGEILSSESVS